MYLINRRARVNRTPVGRDGVELRCTISNGIDGRQKHFKLARKNGAWIVEKADVTAES